MVSHARPCCAGDRPDGARSTRRTDESGSVRADPSAMIESSFAVIRCSAPVMVVPSSSSKQNSAGTLAGCSPAASPPRAGVMHGPSVAASAAPAITSLAANACMGRYGLSDPAASRLKYCSIASR